MTYRNYNPLIKPSGDADGKLTVKLGMRLSQLLDVVSEIWLSKHMCIVSNHVIV